MMINVSPLMVAALRSIVVDYTIENKGPIEWIDVRTDDTITIDDVLTFISTLEEN